MLATLLLLAAGCTPSHSAYAATDRPIIDRRGIDFPAGLQLEVAARGLTAATALAVDEVGGYVFVGDRSVRGEEIRVVRFDPQSGQEAEIYPARDAVVSWFDKRDRLYAPVGGLLYDKGELYVTARDEDGLGVIVAFDLRTWQPSDNRPPVRTVVGELPARGDHSVTSLARHPLTGRLYFGLGSATNSGVVGLDNAAGGWLKGHRTFHDKPLVPLKLFGYRFDTEDPFGGLLTPDKVNTAPFHAFGASGQRVDAADNSKPTAAVYSVDPRGGDLRVEAHGLRHPTGLAFNDFAALYVTNQGMELRGTRPVRDDPDVVVRLFAADGSGSATWYGWPDYSADLLPVTMRRFQPPRQLLARTGYAELSFLIDHAASGSDDGGLAEPDPETLLTARFPPLSGASGTAFVPEDVPGFEAFAGELVVALRGDRTPFANSDYLPIRGKLGRQVTAVDVNGGQQRPLIYNTAVDGKGELPTDTLDRPVAVHFGLGGLWVLDQGVVTYDDGRARFKPGSGRLLLLSQPQVAVEAEPVEATTQPQ